MARLVFATVLCLVVAGLAAAALFVAAGVYDVSATAQHTRPVNALLEATMRQSVRMRARGIEPPALPPLHDATRVARGAACFRAHCVDCHGAPGVPMARFAQGLQPVPDPLVGAARRWAAPELYWIVRHGIKMSGMPAWQHRLPDDDLWAVVALLQALPAMAPQDWRALDSRTAGDRCVAPEAPLLPGDVERGRLALRQHACHACHAIPGLTGTAAHVGPPLEGLARRHTIAGRLPNTSENLVRWIRAPQAVDGHGAMPDMGVSEQAARDMAAYLGTLH